MSTSNELICVNFYGGPGCGKSTTAAGTFFKMKTLGMSVELATEYAKDKVYEGHLGCLEDQIYIFGKQQRRINRLVGHVDYAITDSPILISILYNRDLSESFNTLVMETHCKYNNINFYIRRTKEYAKIGRTQTELEAIDLDTKMLNILHNLDIRYHVIDGDEDAPNKVLNMIRGIK